MDALVYPITKENANQEYYLLKCEKSLHYNMAYEVYQYKYETSILYCFRAIFFIFNDRQMKGPPERVRSNKASSGDTHVR